MTHRVVSSSQRLFAQALDYQLAHPTTVVRFYPATPTTPDWVEVDSRVALYELDTGRVLRVRVTAEHEEGTTTAYRAVGARAHINTRGWWMLTDVDSADPTALRDLWLRALRRPPPRFEPDLTRATVHASVTQALDALR